MNLVAAEKLRRISPCRDGLGFIFGLAAAFAKSAATAADLLQGNGLANILDCIQRSARMQMHTFPVYLELPSTFNSP